MLWNCLNPYPAEYHYLLHTSANLQHSSHKNVFASKAENSVKPDQLASEQPADLDLDCLHELSKG